VLALVLTTALIATISIGFYFRYTLRDPHEGFLREQLESYTRVIIDAIGTPPDTLAARKLTRIYPLDIRIERSGWVWTTSSDIATRNGIRNGGGTVIDRSGDSLLVSNYDSHLCALLDRGGWNYVIRMRAEQEDRSVVLPTVVLFTVLILLFIAAYLYVEYFLRPVKELMLGVQAVSAGDLQYRVPASSNDELGELAQAFNSMSEQIAAILASKRRLLFDVSHELRSPLTRMNVALAMLPEGKAKISLERNIRELNTMITELLENERLAVLGSKLVVEQVDVVKLARNVIETFGHDTGRIEFDSLTDRLEITADSQRLTVALRNVISNALKYSSESDGPVRVSVFPDDAGARMVVVDHGIGIPEDAHDKVFEAFYRTDDSRSRETGGYGLGLPLTKSIIEAHGGAIQLSSAPGAGTRISMWLPKAPSPDAIVRTMTPVQQGVAG
jgi:signal transduction histidine kinase